LILKYEVLKSVNRPTESLKMSEFDFHVKVHRVKFLIIKPTRCTKFSNLFFE